MVFCALRGTAEKCEGKEGAEGTIRGYARPCARMRAHQRGWGWLQTGLGGARRTAGGIEMKRIEFCAALDDRGRLPGAWRSPNSPVCGGGEDRCRKAREGGVFWNRRVMHILCFVDQSGGEKFGVVLLGITHTRHETGSSGKGEGKEILRGVQYA